MESGSKTAYCKDEENLYEYINRNFERSDSFDPAVYIAWNKTTFEDSINMIRRVVVADGKKTETCEKVIMLVGATGSGRTTLINVMLNYILGVKASDDFRVKLIDEIYESQACSHTRYITAYTIHHRPWFEIPFSLTIIDTPGFDSTEGIVRDRFVTNSLEHSSGRNTAMGLAVWMQWALSCKPLCPE